LSERFLITYNAGEGRTADGQCGMVLMEGTGALRNGARRGLDGSFISYRFAVAVIAVLFGASAVGWIATELVPPDFLEREELYRNAWGTATAKLVLMLRLYDPFHSFWYRLVLALFFVVLLLCVLTRWRRLAARSWRAVPPAGADEVKKKLSFEFSWRLLESGAGESKDPLVRYAERFGRAEPIEVDRLRGHFSCIASLLRKRGFSVVSREDAAGIRFAAFSGRWRSPGTMLFHCGILAITIGGVIGSYGGWREMMLMRVGTSRPLPHDSTLTVRVEDFEIVKTEDQEIKDFISTISILDARGSVVTSGAVEVNRPMKAGGCRIYQSEYTIDENEFKRARIVYSQRGVSGRRAFDLVSGSPVEIADSTIAVAAVRFVPDFRMGPDGPFSASAFARNPALEVEVSYGEQTERGWLFLYHGDFNKPFTAPVELTLDRIEPIYYTGLEVSANPGSGTLLAGFAIATLGLLLMYVCNPRVLKGVASAAGLVVAGTEYRWKTSFEREFATLREEIRREIGQRGCSR
jgi:cytochrome c biogenesis protein